MYKEEYPWGIFLTFYFEKLQIRGKLQKKKKRKKERINIVQGTFAQIDKIKLTHPCLGGFPGGSVVKNLPANAGDMSSIPGSGRSPGVENGNPLKYPCLGNFMERGAWTVAVHGIT